MFIGSKEIKSTRDYKDEVELIEVTFADDTVELFSKKMYEVMVTDAACDLTELREKRITPIVQEVLKTLRDWGIRLSELPYFGAVLNNSIDQNTNEALIELWGQHMPKPLAPDEVSLIIVDKVLKQKRVKLEDVLKG